MSEVPLHGVVLAHAKEERYFHVGGLREACRRFRGGLVLKADRLCVSLNSRLESNKEEEKVCHLAAAGVCFSLMSGRDCGWNPWQWIRLAPEYGPYKFTKRSI